jgi:hypothetical protein
VVDTVFTTGGTTKDARVGKTQLTPGVWNLEWTVLKGNSGNGFEQLIAAQQAIGGGDTLEYQSRKTIVRGTGSSGPAPAPQIAGNKITQNIGQYTATANAVGSANFNLEYVPFGEKANWGGQNKPVWIIRNGVNDEPQNTNTTFADSAVWNGTTNGNGAVAFAVTIVEVTGIDGVPTTTTVGNLTLTGTVSPSDATNLTIAWTVTSQGNTGATITGNTLNTTAAGTGTVTVTATIANGLSTGPYTQDFTIKVYPVGAVLPSTGTGDNTAISEENLLTVLGVTTVADAIDELHQRISSGNMGGLKLGMYLDLPILKPTNNDSTITLSNENLRIVIASFNQYKDTTNTEDHIKFVFKNIPVQKKMRSSENNYGGYPYTSGSYGTPELKAYLEVALFNGLLTALGHDYFYEVTRNITEGSYDAGWKKVSFAAKIFIDTEKEVFGNNTSGTEEDLTQKPLYARGGTTWRIKKYNGSTTNNQWWVASPRPSTTTNFTLVHITGISSSGGASLAYGVAPAVCIK